MRRADFPGLSTILTVLGALCLVRGIVFLTRLSDLVPLEVNVLFLELATGEYFKIVPVAKQSGRMPVMLMVVGLGLLWAGLRKRCR